MNLVRYLAVPLALATATPGFSDSGIQATVGTHRSAQVGAVLDLAGRKPGETRTMDAQMLLGVIAETGDDGHAGFYSGYGVEKRFKDGVTVGGAVIGYLLFPIDVDPRCGDASGGHDFGPGAHVIVPFYRQLGAVVGADYRVVVREANARLGLRYSFGRFRLSGG